MTLLLALLLTLALLAVIGVAGGVLATSWTDSSSRPAGPGALAAQVLAGGLVAWLLASGILVRTVGLTPASVGVATVLLLGSATTVLALPRTRGVLRSVWPDLGYLAAVAAVSCLVWLPLGVVVVGTTWAPLGSTPWYYGDLAQQIADNGHIPATSQEWGTTVPFLADYRLFSAGTAALVVVSDGLAATQVATVIAVLVLGSGGALLARSLGASPIASLAAVPLAVGTGIGTVRVTAYRPEAWGIGLMLLLVALAVPWLRRGDRGSLVLAVLVAACLAQVHGIALVGGGVLVVAAALALLPEGGGRETLRRLLVASVAMAGGVLLVGLAMGGASGFGHSEGLADAAGPSDPTWEFVRASTGRPPSAPPGNLEIVRAALRRAYPDNTWLVGVVVALAVLALVVAVRHGGPARHDARRFLLFTGSALLGMTLVGAVFALGWPGYVPRRTGALRLVLEATLLVAPLVAGATHAALGEHGWCQRLWPHDTWPCWRDRALAAALLLALGAVGWAGSRHTAQGVADSRPDRDTLAALADLPIAEDAVLLANAYTEGYLTSVTAGEALLGGRAPYTFPDLLDRANRLLRESQRFFRHPRRNVDLLRRNDVSYVLVAEPGSHALANPRSFPVNRGLQALVPERLEPVLVRPDLRVYRVRGDGGAASGGAGEPGISPDEGDTYSIGMVRVQTGVWFP